MKIQLLGFIPAIIFGVIIIVATIVDEEFREGLFYIFLVLLMVIGFLWGLQGLGVIK